MNGRHANGEDEDEQCPLITSGNDTDSGTLIMQHSHDNLWMLSHTGYKRLIEVRRTGIDPTYLDSRLAVIERFGMATVMHESDTEALSLAGFIQPVAPGTDDDAVRQKYQRNPLENVSRINYEITTRCNFTCMHCRNGGTAELTDTNIAGLTETGRVFLNLGIRRFDFIGGEVSKYGNGWLKLSNQLHAIDKGSDWPEPLAVTLYTNGWWLEHTDIQAAGNHYPTEADYLADLKSNGVTHILFSIDGQEALHDKWRKHPGLFQRVLAGLPRVIESGLKPRLSLVVRPDEDISLNYLKPFADAIYGVSVDSMDKLRSDPFNHFSHLIDVGRASDMRCGKVPLTHLPANLIRCKAFFRPAPTLRIMANGEIGICPLMHGEEGYGNIHRRPLVDLLNTMHETPLYRLHASGEIEYRLKELDREAFGKRFDHVCAVRIALNRLALAEKGMYVGSIAKSYHAQATSAEKLFDDISR